MFGFTPTPTFLETIKLPPSDASNATNNLEFKEASPFIITLFPKLVFPPTNNREFIETSSC